MQTLHSCAKNESFLHSKQLHSKQNFYCWPMIGCSVENFILFNQVPRWKNLHTAGVGVLCLNLKLLFLLFDEPECRVRLIDDFEK